MARRPSNWLLVGSLLTSPPVDAILRGQEPAEPLALVAAAEAALPTDPERATLLLWRARAQLADARTDTPASAAAIAADEALQRLLAAADPRDARRRETYTFVARRLGEIARLYRARKWYELAADRLRVAEHFDAEPVSKERRLVDAALGRAAQPGPAPAAARPLIATLTAHTANDGWRKDGEVMRAPLPEDAGDIPIYVSDLRHADHTIRCRIQVGPGDGAALLLIGMNDDRDVPTGYGIAIFHSDSGKSVALSIDRVGRDYRNLHAAHGTNRVADGFHEVVVHVRGRHLRAELDGSLTAEGDVPTDPHGRIGFMVAGNMPTKQPVVYRDLEVTDLPDTSPQPPGGSRTPLQADLQRRLEDAEQLLRDGATEPAVAALRGVATEIGRLNQGVLRDSLEQVVRKLIETNDPIHIKRVKAGQAIGQRLAALAAEYEAAGWLDCALWQQRSAGGFDPADQLAAVSRIEALRAERRAAMQQQRQTELLPPTVDNTLLLQWFAAGKPLFTGAAPFATDATEGLTVGTLSDGNMWGLMPADDQGPGGHYAVHLTLANCDTGLLFDVRGNGDYGFCMLSRDGNELRLFVYRFRGGDWQLLGKRRVEVEPWRLDGWFELEIDCQANGVRCKCMDAELIVERSKLPAPGPVGLGAAAPAGVTGRPVFRGFRKLR